jgi:hypothetical protein
MSEISIFKNRDLAVGGKKAPSELTKSLMKAGPKLKRISPRNGIFRRIVNGDEVGKIKSPMKVVLVGVAPSLQRTWYAKSYDPNAEAAPPDCWTNDGKAPDKTAANPQSSSCDRCPQNIKGSGQGESKACRFKRRVAVVLTDEVGGNNHGDIYQLELASKSIFGKGGGQVFPLNAYIDYVIANGENIDGVVTEVSFNEDNDNQSVLFRAVDFVSSNPDLLEVVEQAVASPEAQKAILLNVAVVDKGESVDGEEKPNVKAPPVQSKVSKDEDDDGLAEPVKRQSKKATVESSSVPKKNLADVVSDWSDDE